MVMLAVSAVPAFAMDDLTKAKNDVESYAKQCLIVYVQYHQTVPQDEPTWSAQSEERMQTAVDTVISNIRNCTTVEETNEYKALLDDAVEKMCISETELQWMVDYMKKDYNSTGYYDDETYAELKVIYEEALAALESGEEYPIHVSYVNMRNELNKLCVYNKVAGDADQDGKFTIKDCSLMQMYLTDYVTFNSSQMYVLSMTHNTNISSVSARQMALVDLTSDFVKSKQEAIDNLSKAEKIDVSTRLYMGEIESANSMYEYDRYVWWV